MPPRSVGARRGTTRNANPASSERSSSTLQNDELNEGNTALGDDSNADSLSGGRSAPAKQRIKYQPKSNARRTQTERESQEKAEAARQQRRAAEAARYANRVHRGSRGVSRRGGGGVRGGLSGWRQERAGPATGPLSGPTHDEGSSRGTRGAGSSITWGQKGSTSSVRGKGKVPGASGKVSGIKKEDQNDPNYFESALDEEDEKGIDINKMQYIDLLTDDDSEHEDSASASVKPTRTRRTAWAWNPVRLQRSEHIPRSVAVNTTASSTTSAHIRRKAKEAGIDADQVELMADDGGRPMVKGVKSKGKEPVGKTEPRKWQGVFPDEDLDVETKVKQEIDGEAEGLMVDAESAPVIASDPKTKTADTTTKPAHEDGITTDIIKPKKRRTPVSLFSQPILRTPEDHAEWARYQDDMMAIVEELGPSKPELPVDQDGNATVTATEMIPDRRRDLVYLFQLPPALPNLITSEEVTALATEKQQAAKAQQEASEKAEEVRKDSKGKKASAKPRENRSDADAKVEEDNKDFAQKRAMGPRPDINATVEEDFQGHVGTLTVYESGTTVLDWGGIEFELGRGIGTMLQEVTIVDHAAATVSSMGQVAGSFVVRPSWDSLFAAEAKEAEKRAR
jgi:hypothetical protein